KDADPAEQHCAAPGELAEGTIQRAQRHSRRSKGAGRHRMNKRKRGAAIATRSPLDDFRLEASTSTEQTRPQASLSEAAIQRSVFQPLRARGAPGVFAFHPANGGYRRKTEAKILKGLGVRAGVPDIIAIHNGRCFALELKAEGGRTTDKQLATIGTMKAAGAVTAIAEGLDQALAWLEAEGLLRGHVS